MFQTLLQRANETRWTRRWLLFHVEVAQAGIYRPLASDLGAAWAGARPPARWTLRALPGPAKARGAGAAMGAGAGAGAGRERGHMWT